MINEEKAKQSFAIACQQYEEAKQLIAELSTLAKSVNADFSFEIAMRQFDYILQATLLRVAAEDGYFLEEEKMFIEKITDCGDLLKYISAKHNVNLTWNDLFFLDNKELKDISLKIFAVDLEEIMKNFILPFAIVDAVLPKDYADILCEKMLMISIALCTCDADETGSATVNRELNVALVLVKEHFEKMWNEVVEKANSEN